jgi:hypothetical protein
MSAKKSSLVRFTLLGAAQLSLSACVPWPHHELSAPEIIGSVELSGARVAHAHIQLSDMLDASGHALANARTVDVVADADGHFRIGPIRRFAWTSHVNRCAQGGCRILLEKGLYPTSPSSPSVI